MGLYGLYHQNRAKLCEKMIKNLRISFFCCTFAPAFRKKSEESCLSGRKSRTRNAVYALRRIGGSNPSLSAVKE